MALRDASSSIRSSFISVSCGASSTAASPVTHCIFLHFTASRARSRSICAVRRIIAKARDSRSWCRPIAMSVVTPPSPPSCSISHVAPTTMEPPTIVHRGAFNARPTRTSHSLISLATNASRPMSARTPSRYLACRSWPALIWPFPRPDAPRCSVTFSTACSVAASTSSRTSRFFSHRTTKQSRTPLETVTEPGKSMLPVEKSTGPLISRSSSIRSESPVRCSTPHVSAISVPSLSVRIDLSTRIAHGLPERATIVLPATSSPSTASVGGTIRPMRCSFATTVKWDWA